MAADDKVANAETQLQATLNVIPAYTWYALPSGVLTFVNERTADYLGLPKDHPLRFGIDIGASWDSHIPLLHPDDQEESRRVWSTCLRTGSAVEISFRIRNAEGGYRWFLSRVELLRASDGTPLYWIGVNLDIDDAKRAEQELRRSEAYLAEAQRLSHTGTFGWKPDSGEIVWSEETYRIFEYDRDTKPALDMVVQRVHPNDRALAQQVIDRASQPGTDFEHEYRLLLADGRVKHVHALAHVVQDASGNREFVGAVTDITERKTTEEKIRRLVEAGILGIFFASVDGAIVEANQAFLQMLQYDRQDLVSGRLRWADLTPAEWRERDERSLAEFLETGVFHYEKEYFRKDGSRVPVLVGGARLQNPNEGVVYVLDLSEQKRAQEALRSSEAYLAEAQKLSHTGSFGWKPDSGEIGWTDETYRIFEYDRAEKPTLNMVFQRIHPHDRALAQQVIEGVSRSTDFEHEYRLVMPSGAIKHIHVRAHALPDTFGRIEVVGAVTDITERKTAEEKIREQEMELRQILDFASWHVAVLGADGKAIYLNKAGLDYHGLTHEAWQDYDPHRLIHPDDHDRILTGAGAAKLLTGEPFEIEARLLRKDGKYRWFLFRFNPLRDGEGRITRWYVTNADIEDRKRAEQKLQLENAALREEIDQTSMFEEIVGTSPALQTVLSRISKVAPSDSTVLITGETGTGKELFARAIHRRSQRSGRAFVSVNCAAIPRDLVASELFGHEKGAFTGAMQRRLGRFEMADGGTIFLDEVGELSPDTQVALLRVLQEREFERVGGGQPIRVDIRVIAATNRDLQAAVANGTFRQDLFYRLNVFPIEVPPLRERKNDILMLVEYFAQRYASRAGKTIRSIEKKTLELLQCYQWPGNIRELQNVIERSIILSSADVLSVDEMWLSQEPLQPESRVEASRRVGGDAEPRSEREIIEAALVESRGRVSGPSGAAAKLGIPPSTLDHRIKALGIHKEKFKFR
ncbi:MAG: modulated sigma54 specific transcriptional regulator, Fis family [Candidatus Angelobacter sp.]|nr:modulated sigma54 specific transcriptional regulator, Fis family [Candidatus Angelobacter sp.]